jgi:cation:H+ antiporter
MSIGNILGSNMLNILFVVGVVSLFRPLAVEPIALSIHFPVMIVFTVLLLPFAWSRFQISRLEGALLLAGYVGYLSYLVIPLL